MIRWVFWKIILYAFLVFFVSQYWGDYDFEPLKITSNDGISDVVLYLVLGGVFWIVYDIIRRVIQVVTKPLSWLTLWLLWVLLNIVAIYGFAYIVSFVLELGVVIEPWTPVQIILFAIIVRIIDMLF